MARRAAKSREIKSKNQGRRVFWIVAVVAVVGIALLFAGSDKNRAFNAEDNTIGAFLASQKSSSQAGSCTSSSIRPCYDMDTGKKIIGLNPKGADKAFASCLKNSSPNDKGDLSIDTAYCSDETFSYCYEGRSKILIRKFEGKCRTGTETKNPLCKNYYAVPYHEIFGALEPTSWDLDAGYPENFNSFKEAFWGEDGETQIIASLMRSKSGALFGVGSKLELSDLRLVFVPVVYKSNDNGRTWSSTQLQGEGLYTLVQKIVEDSKGVMYAIGKDLWKSTDNGATWQQMPTNFPPSFWQQSLPSVIRDIAVLKDDSLIVSVDRYPNWCWCSYSEIYKSTNGGATWSLLIGSGRYWGAGSFTELDDGSILFSDLEGIYKYKNGIVTKTMSLMWQGDKKPLLKASDGTIYLLAAFEPQQQAEYLYGYGMSSYKSIDNGNTWKRTGELKHSFANYAPLIEASDGAFYAALLSYCWGGVVYKSTDKTRSWEIFSGNIPYLSDPTVSYGMLSYSFTIAEVAGNVLNAGNAGVIFKSP